MKDLVKIIVISVFVGLLFSLPNRCSGEVETIVKTDTIYVYDTIKVIEPVVKDSVIVRTEKNV